MKAGASIEKDAKSFFESNSVLYKWMYLKTPEGKQVLKDIVQDASLDTKKTVLNSLSLRNEVRTIPAARFAQEAAYKGDPALKDLFVKLFAEVLTTADFYEFTKEDNESQSSELKRPGDTEEDETPRRKVRKTSV
ncbi:MAG: hypothetical protein JSR17_08205 [Proteobacteria bacterium]|nr:hypothetical protein [Pseudomonadota bacterium]